MTLDFSGRHCLVTGGTRGIGKAIALTLMDAGALVTVTGKTKISQLDPELKDARFLNLDLTCENSFLEFEKNLKRLPPFDVLINNAGINIIEQFESLQDESFFDIQKVNLHGPLKVSRIVMRPRASFALRHIVNVASIWSLISKKGRISYSTSKSALVGLTRSLAVDLADKNIIVNAVSPGFTDTDLTRASLNEEEISGLKEQIPLSRLSSVAEVASLIAYLASTQNTYITGQNIVIDGGFSIV